MNHSRRHPTSAQRPYQAMPAGPGVFGLTVLRLGVGFIMAAHGYQKLQTYEAWQQQVASLGIPLPELAAPLAVAGELGGGLGLMLGLLTPVASFGVVATLAVAIATVHLGNGLFAKNNGFEFPLALLLAALFFMLRGPGPVSVDALIRRRTPDQPEAATSHTPARETS